MVCCSIVLSSLAWVRCVIAASVAEAVAVAATAVFDDNDDAIARRQQ